MFKNKYIIGIVLAILTGFSSCADLDLAPLGSPEAGEISEERQAFIASDRVYSVMKDFRYTWSMQCFGDVLSNDCDLQRFFERRTNLHVAGELSVSSGSYRDLEQISVFLPMY